MNSKVSSGLKALLINQNDNVGIALNPIPQGNSVSLDSENGTISELIAMEDIPLGHKIAIKSISEGKHIIKYGEKIGITTTSIKVGAHVHIHNVESMRGKKRHMHNENL